MGTISTTVRVLVCEDAEDTREMLMELLRSQGFSVVGVGNGREAIASAATEDFHAALLDIGLPDITGFEVAKTIRAAPLRRRIRLIAVTGYGTSSDLARSREAGFDLHLTKPVKLEQLLAALRTVRD